MLHLLALVGRAYIEFITFLFLAGTLGSALVLVMTFWEDMLTLAGKGEPDARGIRNSAPPKQAGPRKATA